MRTSDQAQSAKKPIEDDAVRYSTAASALAADQVPAEQKLSMPAKAPKPASLDKKCAGCGYTKTIWDFFEDERKKAADAVCLPFKIILPSSQEIDRMLTYQ